ncbi:hypothetical protein A3D70_02000 [Candidatus Adlerbacteria bacterium RIFCSPHIGHO2_02_FULL_54_18]|uniref:Uncharacterized protein n=1 Tax=Candidatus Adlerbacteria bacterium RIFCSPHIGHO2_02_FULL_54_18 TaxID=1797241 RepID=A0A1F4Y2G7_9BACT|nr:MAG: hypothetical protein A3D70_02000 [Candidatus Adlerbacteria bacterium RIFCSPHIGHO2_02_FULL_54_18]
MVRYAKEICEEAVLLRKQGLSYREILKQVPVARSTLSLWLRSVHLSVPQKQILTQKKLDAARRGAETKRKQRLLSTEKLINKARQQIGKLSARERLLVGVALYWAEGAKQRVSSISAGVNFNNSDPLMLKFFKEWLLQSVGVAPLSLKFEIYLHSSQKNRLSKVKKYWAKALEEPVASFATVYFKKNVIRRNRKNTENGYYGLVRVRVRGSTDLNRTIAGWVEGMVG